jgi:hypothetical protein
MTRMKGPVVTGVTSFHLAKGGMLEVGWAAGRERKLEPV